MCHQTPVNDDTRTEAGQKTSGVAPVWATEQWEKQGAEGDGWSQVALPNHSLSNLLDQGTRVCHNPRQELGHLPLL